MSTERAPVSNSSVAEQVKEIVAATLRIDPLDARFTDETNLYELGLESLNVVELLTQIEMAYDITIDVEDLSADLFTCFGTLIEFVHKKVEERG